MRGNVTKPAASYAQTVSDIPIVRLARWVVRRRASCEFCRTEPRVEIDGERRYCSTKCAEQDAWAQANG